MCGLWFSDSWCHHQCSDWEYHWFIANIWVNHLSCVSRILKSADVVCTYTGHTRTEVVLGELWWESSHIPNSVKTWACIWIAYSLILASGWGLGTFELTEGKVSETSWPSVSSATSVCISNMLKFSCMCNHKSSNPPPKGFISGRTSQSYVCECVPLWASEYATVALISLKLLNYGLVCE